MEIKFVDINQKLVSKVSKAIKYLPFENIEAVRDSIFAYDGLIVTASNPEFTMGGGLDYQISEYYPAACKKARTNPGKNQRIGKIIFTITVGKDLKATRELVAKALKFALKSTKNNETILISGLGTGIGGLDEDDFVWLFLQAVCEKFGYGWGIKFTQADGNSYHRHNDTGKYTKYIVGRWLEVPEAKKDGEDCGYGLHLGKDFVGAGNYNLPGKIFFCLFDKKDVCGKGDDKIRVRKLLVLAQLPKWLGYGPKGKNIISKVDKKINAEDYNPYQATKLPDTKTLKPFARKLAQVWDQVGAQVGDQVWAQVRDQVGDQVWDQVGDQVRDQVGDQVGAQVGAQVWAQVWATSYWAINVRFDLGLSHWFGDFLKLGVMLVFVRGKIKVFGKKGKYLGEYGEEELK